MQNNTRLLLINRRDYPGSEPYSAAELKDLATTTSDNTSSVLRVDEFVKERVEEIVECLSLLIAERDIPKKSILVTGWSIGCTWTMAFLAHASKFKFSDVDLASYVRGVTLYGAHQLINSFMQGNLADQITYRSSISCPRIPIPGNILPPI
jgi:hypothetical protein